MPNWVAILGDGARREDSPGWIGFPVLRQKSKAGETVAAAAARIFTLDLLGRIRRILPLFFPHFSLAVSAAMTSLLRIDSRIGILRYSLSPGFFSKLIHFITRSTSVVSARIFALIVFELPLPAPRIFLFRILFPHIILEFSFSRENLQKNLPVTGNVILIFTPQC